MCVQWFQFNKAEISNPAHFIKMFNQKSKQNHKRRRRHTPKTSSFLGANNNRKFVFYIFLEDNR